MKRVIAFLASLVIVLSVSITAFAGNINSNPLVVDNAGVLNDSQKTDLEVKLSTISQKLDFDVVAVIEQSISNEPMDYADDYFDYNGYGFGNERDGCLLLIVIDSRDWWVSTRGFGIKAVNDNAIDHIGDVIKPELKEKDWAEGIILYADTVNELVTNARDGHYYTGRDAKTEIKAVLISLAIGMVAALIIIKSVKSSYKPVRFNRNASNYLVNGSLQVTGAYDNFLYSNVTQTRIERDTDSGGTHTSSSGASHGGGGGKF